MKTMVTFPFRTRSVYCRLTSLYFCISYLIVASILIALPVAAQEQTLEETLNSAAPDAVISLEGGDWGSLKIRGKSPSIIRSVDPKNPARISSLDLRDVDGLTFENIVFEYDWSHGDPVHLRPFKIVDSKNVELTGVLLLGDNADEGKKADKGYPSGTGLLIDRSHGVTLRNSEISNFHRGVVTTNSSLIKVLRNDIHSLRSDGLDFAQVQDVVIEGNIIHDFIRSPDSKDHADMIQFWTRGTDRPSTGVIIRDNVLNSGQGSYTQSIFMRNEAVDKEGAGSKMFYRDVIVEENVIINAHLHGITIGETDNAIIRGNTLVHNSLSAGDDPTRSLWMPQIRVSENSRNVTVERNIAASFPDLQPGWRMTDNFAVQPYRRMDAGHYAQIFAPSPGGDPSNLSTYTLREGGPAKAAEAGAGRLR